MERKEEIKEREEKESMIALTLFIVWSSGVFFFGYRMGDVFSGTEPLDAWFSIITLLIAIIGYIYFIIWKRKR